MSWNILINTSFCCSPRTLSRLRVSSGCSVLWVVSSIFARSMVLGSCHSQILLIESAIVVKIPSSRSFEKLYPSFATFVVGKCFVIPSVPVIPPNSLSIPLRVDRTRNVSVHLARYDELFPNPASHQHFLSF